MQAKKVSTDIAWKGSKLVSERRKKVDKERDDAQDEKKISLAGGGR